MSAAAGLIQGMHAAVAWGAGPHWLINDADAKAYGLALANALRHLPIVVAQKYVDYSAFALAVLTYDAPRFAISMRLRAQANQPRRGPAQVFYPFASAPPPNPQPAPQETASGFTTPQPPTAADLGPIEIEADAPHVGP